MRPAEPDAGQNGPPALIYDRGGGVVPIRGFRLLVALTLVNTVLLALMVIEPQLFPFARQQIQSWKDARAEKRRLLADLAAQQKCQYDAPPPTKVTYTEDPDEAIALSTASLGSYETLVGGRTEAPRGWVSPVRAALPDYYGRFLEAANGKASWGGMSTSGYALLFLHERSDPSGRRFLVSVRLHAETRFQRQGWPYPGVPSNPPADVTVRQTKQRWIVTDVWPLGTTGPSVDARGKLRQMSLQLWLPDQPHRDVAKMKPGASLETPPAIDYGNKLRFFAGQSDAKDPSHFTIAYELDGRPGTIDGWLRSAGPELRPREGRATADSNGIETWHLTPEKSEGPNVTPPTTLQAE